MRLLKSFLTLAALDQAEAFIGAGDDTTSTLLAWQILKNGGDMSVNQQISPLMMAELFGNNSDANGDNDIQKMLLMHSFSNPDIQNWLPFILNSEKDMTDKLIMMSFLKKQESQGLSSMDELMPLMMMQDNRHCTIADSTGADKPCTCTKSKSDTMMKIMLLTGNGFMSNSPQQNLFYMLFNNKEDCECTFEHDKSQTGVCANDDMSGIDPLLMYFMMNSPMSQSMSSVPLSARSAGLNQLIASQTMGLGQDYQWLMNIENTDDRRELAKTQMMQMMNIPPAVINMLDRKKSGEDLTPGDKFAMLNYITGGVSDMPAEITAMFINPKTARKFYISSALSSGQVPEIAGMLMMALEEGAPIEEVKNVLVQVASGQLNPEQFSIINKPYVPELPVGVYPGQDLFFIHLHLLQSQNGGDQYIDTCAMHDLRNRMPCQPKLYGGRGPTNAEQCESSPYCCWNPIQITDDQAMELASKPYRDIPWCYYNVFFVYHDTYSVKVARPLQVASKFWDSKYRPANINPITNQPLDFYVYDNYGNIENNGQPKVLSQQEDDDRLAYEEERLKNFDRHNTAFATPAQCPGLFKYGLKLNPLIYARAMSLKDGAVVDGADSKDPVIKELIHERKDCGFPGIPKFQCVAIRGCCWDENNYQVGSQTPYKIPQCYEKINVVPESIFKIVDAPEDLRPAAGDCNNNFFRLPQLYYEREACNYGMDMYKYDGIASGLTPLDQPSAEDCMLKLGCCWEDDEEVMNKYQWLPRCYKRQRSDVGVAGLQIEGIQIDELVARSADLTK